MEGLKLVEVVYEFNDSHLKAGVVTTANASREEAIEKVFQLLKGKGKVKILETSNAGDLHMFSDKARKLIANLFKLVQPGEKNEKQPVVKNPAAVIKAGPVTTISETVPEKKPQKKSMFAKKPSNEPNKG